MNRVEFKNRWLVGDQHGLRHDGLDMHATVDVTVDWKNKGASASSLSTIRLRLLPFTSFACAPGSRVKIAQTSHEYDGACATVQRVLPEDDRCVVRVDATDKEAIVDPRPDTVTRTARPAYSTGDHLMVHVRGGCRDCIVLEWLGGQPESVHRGGRHRVRFHPLDADSKHADQPETEDEVRDLNDYNHSVQRFPSAGEYEVARANYCNAIVQVEDKVEDAITGNELRIEDQLICVKTQNIGETVKRSDEAWNNITDVKELVELLLKVSGHYQMCAKEARSAGWTSVLAGCKM